MNLSKCDRINFIENKEFCRQNFKAKPLPVSRATPALTKAQKAVISIEEVMGAIEKELSEVK